MRIIREKNLAFADQPRPIPANDVPSAIEARKAVRPLDEAAVDLRIVLPTTDEPKLEIRSDTRSDRGDREVRVRVHNFKIGQHVFPPQMRVRALEPLGNKSASFSTPLEVEPLLPDHLDLQPQPIALPRELQTQPFLRAFPRQGEQVLGNQATTVFPPENRRIFHDTAYPWSTCGRVDTPLGFGSGVMVGPRHVLTVSHVIQWNGDGTAGWVRFRPSFFDGSTPFGEAWGTVIYSKWKVSGPTIDFIEGMYDYVVVVLDGAIGNLTGWMGSRGYTDAWDGGAYWAHVGYPGDLSAGNRPSFENSISLDGMWYELDSHEAMAHHGDVWPGQSGGPFFGWWSGDVGPRVVAVQSSQNSSENNASGGQDLVDLIIRARSENP